tara:strand:+ start:337 stop:570 length:234 start_codon:yes stop_codon:yes gene_type:complete
MTQTYHVTVERDGDGWRTVCPALRDHGAVSGGDTREEALVHIENVLSMILAELEAGGATPPPDAAVPGGILLTIETG